MAGYIGTTPVPQATQHRESFTATGGQTSFATVGYTPQFIDVYLNGVKLAPADYTATNGSDVVLASGATASDILEIVAYTPFEVANQTFTGTTTAANLTVTGAFTSQGIDDNADAVAITIDSSENVGIGTSSPNSKLSITESTVGDLITVTGANGTDLRIGNHASANGGIYINSQAASDDLRFRTQGSDRMTIDSAGNVGIGVSSISGVKMDVLATASDNLVARFENNHATGSYGISVKAGDDSGNYAADFANKSGTSLMRIRGDGSVGIGTSSPSAPLTVETSATTNVDIKTSATNGTAQLRFSNDARTYSLGIDNSDNFFVYDATGTSTRMIIDSSGNLLVGTTDTQPPTNNDASGIALRTDGKVAASRSNGISGDFNNGSNGDILWFRKAGTVMGALGSSTNTEITLAGQDAGIGIIDHAVVPTQGDGVLYRNDNEVDLGRSDTRFKDLYLSGGVYLGGTGSANQLDDYEEGTWTPVMKDSTSNQVIATTSTTANYTKIGRLVWVNVETTRNTGSSFTGTLKLTGLPFTSSNRSGYSTNNGSAWFDGTGTDDVTTVHGGRNSTEVLFKKVAENSSYLGSAEFENTRPVYTQFWYMATDGD